MPASAPAASARPKGGAPTGNKNAAGHKKKADPAPLWHQRARRYLANDYKLGRFRNWGGDAKAPNLHGMTVTAPDPRKTSVPNAARPYLASYNGNQTWHASPASARAEIEAAFVRQQNAKRETRLAANPFDDPLRRAALYRGLQALRGLN